MNKLTIKFFDDKSGNGMALIDLYVEEGGVLKTLFKGKVDRCEFINWLMDNEREIRFSDFPCEHEEKGSIAKKITSFYEDLNVDDDDLVDMMFSYRATHCLRFANRGADIPEIYIGKLGRCHEVSLFNEHEQWQYVFNVDEFFNCCKK